MKNSVSIVIVNWNAGLLLRDCLASIVLHHADVVDVVIVVDNASSDGSVAELCNLGKLPFLLKIVRNRRNLGFAAACNQGARLASAPYLLFLNPDTRLLSGSLSVPLLRMEAAGNSDIGVCGIQLLDETGSVARSCARFPTLFMFIASAFALNRLKPFRCINMHMSDWSHDETSDVDHVMGAFYLIRHAIFLELSGFDERFFVYLEDIDFSLRMTKLAFRSVYLIEARAFHAGGGSSRHVKAHRLFYSLRSRLLFGFKHFRPRHAWALLLLTLLVEPLTRSSLAIFRLSVLDFRQTWQAYGMLYGDIPRILKMRHG